MVVRGSFGVGAAKAVGTGFGLCERIAAGEQAATETSDAAAEVVPVRLVRARRRRRLLQGSRGGEAG